MFGRKKKEHARPTTKYVGLKAEIEYHGRRKVRLYPGDILCPICECNTVKPGTGGLCGGCWARWG